MSVQPLTTAATLTKHVASAAGHRIARMPTIAALKPTSAQPRTELGHTTSHPKTHANDCCFSPPRSSACSTGTIALKLVHDYNSLKER